VKRRGDATRRERLLEISRLRVCILPAQQSPSPKLETTRSLRNISCYGIVSVYPYISLYFVTTNGHIVCGSLWLKSSSLTPLCNRPTFYPTSEKLHLSYITCYMWKKRAKTPHHHWILVARRLKSSYIFTRVRNRSCYLGWISAAPSGSGSAGSFSWTAAGNRSLVVTDLERF